MLSWVLLVASFLVALCQGTDGNLINAALGKHTEISSVYSSDYKNSSNAVNGNAYLTHIRYCFHTMNDPHSWFRVDLGRPYTVHSVVITNRGDCCGERLNKFRVVVSAEALADPEKSADDRICYDHDAAFTTGQTKTLACRVPLTGRFVTVVLMERNFLHFCELQVLVEPAGGDQTSPVVTSPAVTSEAAPTPTEPEPEPTPTEPETEPEPEPASEASSGSSGAATTAAQCTKVCEAPFVCVLTRKGGQKCGCAKGASGKACRAAGKATK